jgi:glycosyltransferase involved in cell wall biosynthesis
MIKVLGLALYGPLAASTRYRLEQYVSGLSSLGIDLKISYLLGNDYLRRRFAGDAPSIINLVCSGFKRFNILATQNEYDVLILHCELFPLLPGLIERGLLNRPYVYDFDDAFYLKYQSGRMSFAKHLLAGKFEKIMEGAAAISAGNNLLAQYASKHNLNTFHLPTVVDTQRYISLPESRGHNIFTIGWIGSPSTTHHLSELVLPLSILGQEGEIRFIVIGGKAPIIPFVKVIEIDWNEDTEVELINTFDVGVMPLLNDPWSRGKCSFKLIQYMACEVPVVASPVGANNDVIDNESGYLAETTLDWVKALRELRDNPYKRIKMGQDGRNRIVKKYSLECNLPAFANIIRIAFKRF